MFGSLGHEVTALHRCQVGGLSLEGLPRGDWRHLSAADLEAVFTGPTQEEIFAAAGLKEAAKALGSGKAAGAGHGPTTQQQGSQQAGAEQGDGNGEGEEEEEAEEQAGKSKAAGPRPQLPPRIGMAKAARNARRRLGGGIAREAPRRRPADV